MSQFISKRSKLKSERKTKQIREIGYESRLTSEKDFVIRKAGNYAARTPPTVPLTGL